MDGHDVEVEEPGQRILVHGVYVGQICDGEEEDGRVLRYGSVALARLVDLLLRLLRDLHQENRTFDSIHQLLPVRERHAVGSFLLWPHLLFLGDVVGEDLGAVEDLDGGLVLEDVALGRGQRVQNLVLDLLERALVVGAGHDEGLTLLLQLRTADDTHSC